MHTSVLPRLACPECQGALRLKSLGVLPAVADALTWDGALICQGCHVEYRVESGIPRLVKPGRKAQLAGFSAAYEELRLKEGWAVQDNPAYYKALPYQDITGKHAEEWKIRGYSFGRLLRRVSRFASGRSLRVVDLGAGCGWLAARLSESGHHSLAVDIDVGPHGLLAGRHLRSDCIEFACVQGELLYPPLAKEQADLIVLNASLHHSSEHTKIFASLYRALAPGGALAIVDSPTYRNTAERDKAQEASARYYHAQKAPELAYLYRGLVRTELLEELSNFTAIECEVTHAPSLTSSLAGFVKNGYWPAQFEIVWARKRG